MYKYYINIGSNSSNLNRNNSYYVLGLYKNTSILNLDKTIYKLKKKVAFLFKYCKKYKNFNFLIINSNKNKFLSNIYVKTCKSFNCSYFNGTWWNGLLKNFKKYIFYNSFKKFKFYKNQYPKFVIYVSRQRFGEYNFNASFLNNELDRISMPNIIFFNDNYSTLKNYSVILSNTRSYLNNYFLFNLSVKIAKKFMFINKKKLFFFILKKFKNLKIKNTNIFIESLFCVKNKKVFYKEVLWDLDLN